MDGLPAAPRGTTLAAMKATRSAARAAHYPGSARALPWRGAMPLSLSVLATLALAGCGGGERVRPSPAYDAGQWTDIRPADPAAANAVLMRAISLVGTPYVYGGDSPAGGFDCSGLVNYVYRDMLDLRLPRTSRALADYQGPRIATDRLAPADLVFFGSGGIMGSSFRWVKKFYLVIMGQNRNPAKWLGWPTGACRLIPRA